MSNPNTIQELDNIFEYDEEILRNDEENQIVLKEEKVLNSYCMACVESEYNILKTAKSYDDGEFEKEKNQMPILEGKKDKLITQHDQETEEINNEKKKGKKK
jgi:hypothetical protein